MSHLLSHLTFPPVHLSPPVYPPVFPTQPSFTSPFPSLPHLYLLSFLPSSYFPTLSVFLPLTSSPMPFPYTVPLPSFYIFLSHLSRTFFSHLPFTPFPYLPLTSPLTPLPFPHLVDGFLHVVLVFEDADHVDRILDDERHDGHEGKQQHLDQVDLLALPCGRIEPADASLHLQKEEEEEEGGRDR